MSNVMRLLRDFPRQGSAVDMVKLIACLLMVVDHVNLIFLDLHPVLWLMGRLVFPLFCFVVAVHALRGIDPKRYLLKLLPFAALSQIPYVWMLWDVAFLEDPSKIVLNVIFTLGVGGVIAGLFKDKGDVFIWLCLFGALIGELFLPTTIFEFGLFGVLLPLMVVRLLAMDISVSGMLPMFTGLLPMFICLGVCNAQLGWGVVNVIEFIEALGIFLLAFLFMAIGSFHVLRHISEANLEEKPRFMPRYFFHIFYPAHLAIIAGLNYFGVFS